MNITFPHEEMQFREGVALDFIAKVDGRRVDVRIGWAAIEALGGATGAETVRGFVKTNRTLIDRTIRAHILARGVPPDRLIELSPNELAQA